MQDTGFFYQDKLAVHIFATRDEMGKYAAQEAANQMRALLSQKEEINVIFAAAPSQNEVLNTLCTVSDIDWSRVNAFHMDEYIGLEEGHPAGFRQFLNRTIFTKLPFKSVHLINGNCSDPKQEAVRYGVLLDNYPPDIVMLGVGENGHIAFNDPPMADFNDPYNVRVVELEEKCRNQQVNDGCFVNVNQVPKYALSVTIPCLTNATYMYCTVPGKKKAKAISAMLQGPVTSLCPASILRKHEHAYLYLDCDAASELTGSGIIIKK